MIGEHYDLNHLGRVVKLNIAVRSRRSVLSQFPTRSTGVRRRSLADRSGTPEFQIQSLPLVTFSAKLGFSCAYDGCV